MLHACLLHAWGVRPSRPIANHHTSRITGRSKGGRGSFPPAIASVPSEKSWRLIRACTRDPLALLPLLLNEVPRWQLPSCSSCSLVSLLWKRLVDLVASNWIVWGSTAVARTSQLRFSCWDCVWGPVWTFCTNPGLCKWIDCWRSTRPYCRLLLLLLLLLLKLALFGYM